MNGMVLKRYQQVATTHGITISLRDLIVTCHYQEKTHSFLVVMQERSLVESSTRWLAHVGYIKSTSLSISPTYSTGQKY